MERTYPARWRCPRCDHEIAPMVDVAAAQHHCPAARRAVKMRKVKVN